MPWMHSTGELRAQVDRILLYVLREIGSGISGEIHLGFGGGDGGWGSQTTFLGAGRLSCWDEFLQFLQFVLGRLVVVGIGIEELNYDAHFG